MNGDKRIFNVGCRAILAGLAASAVLGAFAGRAHTVFIHGCTIIFR